MNKELINTEGAGQPIVTCAACGRRNRLKSATTYSQHCGNCHAILKSPFQSSRNSNLPNAAVTQATSRHWRVAAVVFAIFFFIGVITIPLPWTQYRWAAFQDTVPAYESFIGRNPFSQYAARASERIRLLKEDSVWQGARSSNDITRLHEYLRTYPNGKFVADAKLHCIDLAEQRWQTLAKSRSEIAIRQFLTDYPETTRVQDANNRLQQLYDDFSWVEEQNSIEAYSRYLERNPQVLNRAAVEKKIIDLEVAAIAAGEHGVLPPANPVRSDLMGTHAEVNIENGTGYELTIRYSGRDSKKLILPIGAKRVISLPVGVYQVTGSVSAARVRNYMGTDYLQAGAYEVRFFVQTMFGPSK